MPYLIAILIPFLLLIVFLALTVFEARSGRRVLAARRYAFDAKVSRYAFIIAHVDWGAFSADIVRTWIERATHDIAHGALIAVRALERTLTRVVRTLRSRQEAPVLPPKAEIEPVTSIERITTTVRKAVHRSRRRPAIRTTHVEDEEVTEA